MNKFLKPFIAAGIALATVTTGAAWAKPDQSRYDHENRSHAADYYEADGYYRDGPDRKARRDSSVSFSITVGNDGYYDRRGYRGDYYGRRHGYRGRSGRIVNREVFRTRYRARIVLIEEVIRTRRGPRLLCTVDARGPEAHYVRNKRLRRIARRNCSHRAEIRILA
ncbi:MAG: hypothetical protein AAFW68_04890 [Pseudomonadota bacterium]